MCGAGGFRAVCVVLVLRAVSMVLVPSGVGGNWFGDGTAFGMVAGPGGPSD